MQSTNSQSANNDHDCCQEDTETAMDDDSNACGDRFQVCFAILSIISFICTLYFSAPTGKVLAICDDPSITNPHNGSAQTIIISVTSIVFLLLTTIVVVISTEQQRKNTLPRLLGYTLAWTLLTVSICILLSHHFLDLSPDYLDRCQSDPDIAALCSKPGNHRVHLNCTTSGAILSQAISAGYPWASGVTTMWVAIFLACVLITNMTSKAKKFFESVIGGIAGTAVMGTLVWTNSSTMAQAGSAASIGGTIGIVAMAMYAWIYPGWSGGKERLPDPVIPKPVESGEVDFLYCDLCDVFGMCVIHDQMFLDAQISIG